jgi:septal ring factor EnvC (AmiA/AmiB activator)
MVHTWPSLKKFWKNNERLTVQYNQRTSESSNFNKQIKLCQDKIDLLKQEYAAFSRSLKETEDALAKTNGVWINTWTFF